MGGDDSIGSQMGFQLCADMMLNCPSSGINTRPAPEKIAPMSMSSVYGSGWDPIVPLSQSGTYGGGSSMVSQSNLAKSSSYPMLPETQGISTSSLLVNYPSDLNLAHMLPKLQMFGTGNFPEFVNPFGLPGGMQNSHSPLPPNFSSNRSGTEEKPSPSAVQGDSECKISGGITVKVSPNGKRKRDSAPPSPNKSAEKVPQKDHSSGTLGPKEQDDKRLKTEQNAAGNPSAKQTGKQVKDSSEDEEAPQQNYIHVRARRGQATNSHSLAERVRREKISERMRLLQELVPGCNKITGKAVMLDEIINYVQSLQQQVEFLSMKLATVNPELNFDIERLLTKDILHSRGNNAPILGFDHGMSSHGFTHGIHQGSLTTMPSPASQYHHMSQAVWDNDLQNLLHMGFDSNPSVGNLGPNGSSKAEL